MSKLILITGGSRGLGRSAALHLAEQGYDVVITYNSNKDAANAVVKDIKATGQRGASLQLDVADVTAFPQFRGALQSLIAQWGMSHIDALINNGGIGLNAPLAETDEQQFDLLMNIHLKGVFFLTQTLLDLVADGGSILNVSSGLTRFSFPGYGAYAMMKGGIEVFTRYLAKELGDRRIQVNTLAPGAIETDFRDGAVRDNKDINQLIAGQTALGRVGLPDDIGQAMRLLLSDDARWINGQCIEASGGMFL